MRACQTAIARHDGALVFLHAIVPGVADSAFGIEIARLAGVPALVIERAQSAAPFVPLAAATPVSSAAEVASERIVAELLLTDIASTTPLEALNQLADFQRRLRLAAHEPVGPRALVAEERRGHTAR